MAEVILYTPNNQNWGLWSHASWRDLAINGGILATTAFLTYVIGAVGDECISSSNLTRGMMTVSFSFFVPYTAVQFPSLQKTNKIKSDNLSLFNVICKELTSLKSRFIQIEPKPSESQEELLAKLTLLIRDSAFHFLNVNCPDFEVAEHEGLLKNQDLLTAVSQHLKLLKTDLSKLNDKRLTEELAFWQREVTAIQHELIPDAAPQTSPRAAL